MTAPTPQTNGAAKAPAPLRQCAGLPKYDVPAHLAPMSDFNRNRGRPDGLARTCRECRRRWRQLQAKTCLGAPKLGIDPHPAPRKAFAKHGGRPDGLQSICKTCHAAYAAARKAPPAAAAPTPAVVSLPAPRPAPVPPPRPAPRTRRLPAALAVVGAAVVAYAAGRWGR